MYDHTATNAAFERTLTDALCGRDQLFYAERMNCIGYITDDARNAVAAKALEKEFDFVFYADSDMTFPMACLAKMLRRCAEIPEKELPVIAGMYNSRKDYRLHAYKWNEEKGDYRNLRGDVDPDFKHGAGLYKVDGAGTGCILLDCAVFETIEWPWFEYKYEYKKDIKKRERWSEDLVFCKKLYDKGIHVYLDTEIECGHMQLFNILPDSETTYRIESL
jgi:hypothetical protein